MAYPMFDDSDCLNLTPRQIICPGEPIRITGMQGLWRYVKSIGVSFEAIGPYFPNSPSRNGGRSRIFTVDAAKYPGKRFKARDVADPEVKAISDNAKRRRR